MSDISIRSLIPGALSIDPIDSRIDRLLNELSTTNGLGDWFSILQQRVPRNTSFRVAR